MNVLQLRKLLKEYVGGDMTLLGEIPDDPAVEGAVRNYLPVVESAPASAAAVALQRVTDALLPLLVDSSPKAV